MRKLTTEQFITKAKHIHGNKYDYSDTQYTRSDEKVEIFCKTCNQTFSITALKHSNISESNHGGCHRCCITTGGFGTLTRKTIKDRPSVHNRQAVFYILEMSDNKISEAEPETFMKCGITTKLNLRVNCLRMIYPNIKVVWTAPGNLLECYEMEKAHLIAVGEKYTPLKKFGGSSECYLGGAV